MARHKTTKKKDTHPYHTTEKRGQGRPTIRTPPSLVAMRIRCCSTRNATAFECTRLHAPQRGLALSGCWPCNLSWPAVRSSHLPAVQGSQDHTTRMTWRHSLMTPPSYTAEFAPRGPFAQSSRASKTAAKASRMGIGPGYGCLNVEWRRILGPKFQLTLVLPIAGGR